MSEIETLTDEERDEVCDSAVQHLESSQKALRIIDQQAARIAELEKDVERALRMAEARFSGT